MKEKILAALLLCSLVMPHVFFKLFYEQPVHSSIVLKRVETITKEGTPRFFFITKDYGMKETSANSYLNTNVYDTIEVRVREEEGNYKAILISIFLILFIFIVSFAHAVIRDERR